MRHHHEDPRRVLVLGGARSGKSAFAEGLLAAERHVDYLATAAPRPDDAEWERRIAAHRARRPQSWHTLESGDLAGVLRDGDGPVLVDSVTAWLTRSMDALGVWDGDAHNLLTAEVERLVTGFATTSRRVVLVSDEVGSSIVPDSPAGRLFRDELGVLNQRLAAAADAVHLVVAGLPQQLK